MSASQNELMYSLTDDEKEELSDLLTTLAKTDHPNVEILQTLVDLAASEAVKLEKFTHNSNYLRNFCRTNTDIAEAWYELLNSVEGYPSIPLTISTQKNELTNFELALGLTEFSQCLLSDRNTHAGREAAISHRNKSCDLGFYNALISRSISYFNTLEKASGIVNSAADLEATIKKLKQDVSTLRELYLGIGYFQSGCYKYAIADEILAPLEKKGIISPVRDLTSSYFYQDAANDFMHVPHLENHSYSKNFIDKLAANGDVFSLDVYQKLPFKNWDAANDYFKALLKEKYEETEASVKAACKQVIQPVNVGKSAQDLIEAVDNFEFNAKDAFVAHAFFSPTADDQIQGEKVNSQSPKNPLPKTNK